MGKRNMKRRDFVTLLGGAAAWPLAARAQQPAERVRRIGILMNLPENESQGRIAAIRQGLLALGWTENGNVRIDYRFLGGDAARVRAQAAELVSSAPDLIVAHTSPVVAALKDLTHTIPVVFVAVNDPVGQGFISSLARPGGNITGFTFIDPELVGKWLEMLTEMAPSVRRAALMFNPKTNAYYHAYVRGLGAAPNKLTSELVAAPVRDQAEIEAAIAAIAREPGGGLIGAADVFNVTHRQLIISLAERYRLPALYFNQYFVT
jgi:putative ABC transport system substrate-binding protein